MINFWQKLNKPFFCLAPMDQVTDCAFREVVALYSRKHEAGNMKQERHPDVSSFKLHASNGNDFVLFTEFVSVDGLLHPDGQKRLLRDLKYTEKQRPIVAQVWGTDPEKFYKAAKLIKKLGFDGIDINMGCPQKKEVGMGACAALIKHPKLAQNIIKQTIKGAGKMPVSVKTRLGYDKIIINDWIRVLLKCNLAAITVHGRTKKEMSKAPAHWDSIKDAVSVRDKMKSKTLIIGNGDVQNYADGIVKAKASGVDGVMIGRASFGNPWIFRPDNFYALPEEKLRAMLKHARVFEKWYKGKKSFETLKKHFKAYANGFEGAKELRKSLMEAKEPGSVEEIANGYIKVLRSPSSRGIKPKEQIAFRSPPEADEVFNLY